MEAFFRTRRVSAPFALYDARWEAPTTACGSKEAPSARLFWHD
jgi:hypothetical protein